jgi:hypothetical protein
MGFGDFTCTFRIFRDFTDFWDFVRTFRILMGFSRLSLDFDEISCIFVGFDRIFVELFEFEIFLRSKNSLFSSQ